MYDQQVFEESNDDNNLIDLEITDEIGYIPSKNFSHTGSSWCITLKNT
jgi:hypothetical protein